MRSTTRPIWSVPRCLDCARLLDIVAASRYLSANERYCSMDSESNRATASEAPKRPESGDRAYLNVLWEEEVAGRLPELDEKIWAAVSDQVLLAATVLGDRGTHNAIKLIVNQSVNDLISLLSEIAQADGRPAMRSARTLIEHAINLHSLSEGIASAQRYLDHLELGTALLGESLIGAELLRGKDRRVYQQNLQRAGRRARGVFDAAVERYGPWFRRGWTSETIADRARKHGLTHLYENYRLASLVAHGAAGGSLGSTKNYREGFTIHRTGQSLELTPAAFLMGIRGYASVLDAVAVVRSDLDMKAYRTSIDDLVNLWPAYLDAIRDLDESLWPEERTQSPAVVYMFNRSGEGRWWLHVPALQILVEASPPKQIPTWFENRMAEIREHVIKNESDLFTPTQRWVTVKVKDVSVVPLPGGRVVPELAYLVSPEGKDYVLNNLAIGPLR